RGRNPFRARPRAVPRGAATGRRRRPRRSAVMISLAALGWGDDPPYPPSVGVPASCSGRVSQHRNGTRIASAPAASHHLPPATCDSLASLGWGDDPPYPPSVGVPASSVGRARQRTRTVRGSRRVAPYHLPPTTYHFRLPPPDWRTRTDSRSM